MNFVLCFVMFCIVKLFFAMVYCAVNSSYSLADGKQFNVVSVDASLCN